MWAKYSPFVRSSDSVSSILQSPFLWVLLSLWCALLYIGEQSPSLHVYLHVHPQSLSDSQHFQHSAQSQSKHCQRECLQCRAPSELDAGRISTPHGRRSSQQPTCWLTWSKFEEEEGVCRWRGGSGGGQAAGNCQVVSRPTSLRCGQLIKTTSVLDGPLPQGEGVERDTHVHARLCMCATCGSEQCACLTVFCKFSLNGEKHFFFLFPSSLVSPRCCQSGFGVSGVPDLPRPFTHTCARSPACFPGPHRAGIIFQQLCCSVPLCLPREASGTPGPGLPLLHSSLLSSMLLLFLLPCLAAGSLVSFLFRNNVGQSVKPLEIHTFTLLFARREAKTHFHCLIWTNFSLLCVIYWTRVSIRIKKKTTQWMLFKRDKYMKTDGFGWKKKVNLMNTFSHIFAPMDTFPFLLSRFITSVCV